MRRYNTVETGVDAMTSGRVQNGGHHRTRVRSWPGLRDSHGSQFRVKVGFEWNRFRGSDGISDGIRRGNKSGFIVEMGFDDGTCGPESRYVMWSRAHGKSRSLRLRLGILRKMFGNWDIDDV